MRYRKLLVVAAAAATVVGLAAAASAEAPETEPPAPEWVNEDGSVDLSEVPERLPVAGPDGELAGYVDSDEVFGPPQLTPDEAVEAMEGQANGRPAGAPGPVEPNDEEGGIQQEVPTEPVSEGIPRKAP